MKRTFQPNNRRRRKTHGFRARMSTKNGRLVLKRRRAKGRKRLRPQDRIRKRSEYQVIYAQGRRIPSSSFVLFVMRNGLGRPRLGITATRRVGGAVKRNRAKRLVRDIFRRHKRELDNVDIVLNVRASLPGAELTRLEVELLTRLRPFARKPE